MRARYYLDTSIWMDFYEDRKGYNGEPLGDHAWNILSLIKAREHQLAVSDLLLRELELNYSLEEINGMIKPFENTMIRIVSTELERKEAQELAKKRSLPPGDALHAIIARDNGLILITRDKHFRELEDIALHHKPEELT